MTFRDEVIEAVESGELGIGFCAKCCTEHCGVEPDARNCVCDVCGQKTVFGAEELLLLFA